MNLNSRQKLEIGAYIVTIALAVPSYVFALLVGETPLRDLLINLAATFAGAGFLFFLLNRFFGVGNELTDKVEELLNSIPNNKKTLVTNDERRRLLPTKELVNTSDPLYVLSNTAINFLKAHHEIIVKRVQHGAKIRLIIIDPSSSASNMFREIWRYAPFDKELQSSLDLINNIQASITKLPKVKGVFEVKLIKWIPSCTMIMGNPNGETGKAVISINNPNYSTSETERPHLILEKTNEPHWFNYYKSEFEKVWEDANPIKLDAMVIPLDNALPMQDR